MAVVQDGVALTHLHPLGAGPEGFKQDRLHPGHESLHAQIEHGFRQAFAAGGVHLVAVPIDYSENTRVLVDELRAKVKDFEPAE